MLVINRNLNVNKCNLKWRYIVKEKDKIKLSKEKKEDMISAIQDYFFNKRDEELSDLDSNRMLKFIIEELAPEFYNQGVYDSYKYINDRSEDMLSIQIY